MRTVLTIALLCGMYLTTTLSSAWADGGTRPQDDGVTVTTTSGRSLQGEVDARSDGQVLWLRRTYGKSAVLRPLDWDCVAAVEAGDARWTGAQFRSALEAVVASLPDHGARGEARHAGFVGSGATRNAEAVPSGETRIPVEIGYARVGGSPRPPDPVVPIQWLDIDVRVANWDNDVEPDGVVVRIRPRDAEGSLVAVNGILTVDMLGKEKSPVNRSRNFVRLGRSAEQVRIEDFGVNGAVYRIAFQSPNPVFDTNLVPEGLVHAELSVAGQGVVEASDCTVEFRSYNALRDDLWQAAGSQYFPVERTGPRHW